ncbi:MAG: tRNA 2-thiouridine(34) synthase MnmA [Anaerolineales bacterium]
MTESTMMPVRHVAIAMSGGVDSSVAAALLARQGQAAFGLMLRLWSAGSAQTNRCCTPDDVERARNVAARIGIPFYVLDAKEVFKQAVVDPFVDGYAKGYTPNPCITCNRTVRWSFLLEQALAMGATHLATGHYARIRQSERSFQLLRGVDPAKDQSYVLSVLAQQQLAHAAFPLGEHTKLQVREMAHEMDLVTADRPESQDLCFLGDQDYRTFLAAQGAGGLSPGPIIDTQGRTLGTHQGLARYTIGQRKGIGVPSDVPLYVLQKRSDNNVLIVAQREQLGRSEFRIGNLNWISGEYPNKDQLTVRVRYKAREVPALIEKETEAQARVTIRDPLPDITPGQQAVFYSGELCLGGGMILP